MNKTKLIIGLSLLLIVVLPVFIFLFNGSYAIEDNENEIIIGEVIKLENFARTYKSNTNSDLSITELCFQYIRRNDYDSDIWKSFIGSSDSDFISFVDSNGGVNIDKDTVIVDKNSYKEINFSHMIAVLNAYYRNGEKSKLNGVYEISTHYAGWAGDLLSFSSSIYEYAKNNDLDNGSSSNIKKLVEYTDSLIGTNKDNVSFNSNVMFADLDAYNIYKNSEDNIESLSDSLEDYYINTKGICNISNRNSCLREEFYDDLENIDTDMIKSYFSNKNVYNSYSSINYDDMINALIDDVMSKSFSNYLLDNSIIELTSTSGSSIVGDKQLEIPIYESNLGVAKIKHTNNICDVDIINDVIYITPNQAGIDEITIVSANGKTKATYTVTINNIPPSIVKDLEGQYEFFNDIESTIKFEASGTNNLYSWYISDTKDGEYEKIADTKIASYTMKPTQDMDNKYIKCRISNKGNDTIESTPTLLRVKNVSVGDVVNTTDNSLLLAYSIIFFVISSNVFVVVLKRVNYIWEEK